MSGWVWFQFLVIPCLAFKHLSSEHHHLRSPRRRLSSSHLCVASDNAHHFHAGLLSYPQNIFRTKETSELSLPESLASYNCSYRYDNSAPSFGQCSYAGNPSPPLCPLIEENIFAALRPMQNWTHSFGKICGLFAPSLAQNITEFNVYIMGGSMTFGQSTNGCCCDPNLDSKCPNQNPCLEKFSVEDGDTHPSYCSWGRYFGRWLQSEFPRLKINIISLAARGQGSRVTAEYLLLRYPPNTPKSFKSTDLVFLDFSVNDCSGGFGPRIGSDFESLIRRFLHYGADMPQLIVLETYPFQIAGKYFNWRVPGTGGAQDYTTYYRQVARYYHLPLWSFATSLFDQESLSRDYHPYLRNMASHPSWFVHLNVADTYAAAMKHELHRYCVKGIQQTREEFFSQKKQFGGSAEKGVDGESHDQGEVSLPPVLYSGDEKECLTGGDHRQYHTNAKTEFDRLTSSSSKGALSPPPLDEDELEWEIMNGKTKEILSSSSQPLSHTSPSSNMSSFGMWQLYEDRPSKPGWIIVAQPNQQSHLRFSLKKIDFTSKSIPVMTIGHLRTYEHAGRVTVMMCGRSLGPLTALWPDYQHHRVSITHLSHIDLSHDLMEVCQRLPQEERRVEFHPNFFESDEKFKLLSITFCDQN